MQEIIAGAAIYISVGATIATAIVAGGDQDEPASARDAAILTLIWPVGLALAAWVMARAIVGR